MRTGAVQLPEVVIWVQALGPTAIAVAVALVAFRQWRTAQHKLVLDLFERRYSIYSRVMSGVADVIRDGDVRNNDSLRKVATVRDEAQFVFGKEVTDYLAALQGTLAELGLCRTQYDAGDQSSDWPQRSYDATMKIAAVQKELPALLAPYMKMHQKL